MEIHERTGAAARARLRGALAALIALAALAPGAAPAWGPVGHKAVGAVADALLTPGAQAAVAQLLTDDRDGKGRYSGRQRLAEVADWADEIRGGSADRPRWHYDNRPVCAASGRPADWCAQGDCASAQLAAQLAILADDGRTRAERSAALKWVVHLAGDVHQPLHAADLAEGGNGIRVTPYARAARSDAAGGGQRRRGSDGPRHGRSGESLHAFWDSHLVNLALHAQDGNIPDEAMDALVQRARTADADAVNAAPEQWAAESNRIAREFALAVPGIDCAPQSADGMGARVTLSREYVARGRQIAAERLALAGARLARVVNAALDPDD